MDEGNAARGFRARGGFQLGDRAVRRQLVTLHEPLTTDPAKHARRSAGATRDEAVLRLQFIIARNRGEVRS
jgi:hypothetical protein